MLNSTHKIIISKPCTKNWDAMQITNAGKHCNSCKKEVIDFSILSDEEVKNYLIKNTGKDMCGRFYHHQIDRIKITLSDSIFYSNTSCWKKYVAILLLCFGLTVFNVEVGIAQTKQDSSIKKNDTIIDPTIPFSEAPNCEIPNVITQKLDSNINKVDSLKNDTVLIESDTTVAFDSAKVIFDTSYFIDVNSFIYGNLKPCLIDFKSIILGSFVNGNFYLEKYDSTPTEKLLYNPPIITHKSKSKLPQKPQPENPAISKELIDLRRKRKKFKPD